MDLLNFLSWFSNLILLMACLDCSKSVMIYKSCLNNHFISKGNLECSLTMFIDAGNRGCLTNQKQVNAVYLLKNTSLNNSTVGHTIFKEMYRPNLIKNCYFNKKYLIISFEDLNDQLVALGNINCFANVYTARSIGNSKTEKTPLQSHLSHLDYTECKLFSFLLFKSFTYYQKLKTHHVYIMNKLSESPMLQCAEYLDKYGLRKMINISSLSFDSLPFIMLQLIVNTHMMSCNTFWSVEKNCITEEIITRVVKNCQEITKCALPSKGEMALLAGNTFVWVREDNLYNCINPLKNMENKYAYFKISSFLANYLLIKFKLLSVQFAVVQAHSNEINMDYIVSLSISGKSCEHIKKLAYPIDIYFKHHIRKEIRHITKGVAKVLSDKNEDIYQDKYISVYKLGSLMMIGTGKVYVKFFDLKNYSYRVLLLKNKWPTYDMMKMYSKLVTNEVNVYVTSLSSENKADVCYLGILAFIEDVGSKDIEYSFEVKTVQCHSKSDRYWSTDGCQVGNDTNDEQIHCQCWHLSLFGGSAAIAPKQVELGNDIQLLLDVKDNPKTFIVVISMILLYFMVLVWTRHNDLKDRLQRFVVVLEDNFPGDEWAYLVTVYTGFWIGAGTDANVGFRIYGSKGLSRVHNLQSRQRKVLKSNCDDWFLILAPKSLGNIEKIHIFHDHSGHSPDWYCSKIMVYDLEGQQDYKFIVQKWMSQVEEDECIECFVEPTPTLRSLRRDSITIDNIIFGLRETHLLISIFTRHPRSSVTRSQRLSICICIIIVNMLTSIMFYALEESEFPQYSAHKRRIIIGMESTLLAAPFTFIVIFCFKKSRIITASKSNIPMTLTSTQAVPLESGIPSNQGTNLDQQLSHISTDEDTQSESSSTCTSSLLSKEEEIEEVVKGCCHKCVQQIKLLLFHVITSKAIMPVRIADENEDSYRVRKQWMYFAWCLCETAIFLSAFFIIIYSLKMDQDKCTEWMYQTFKYSLSNIFLMVPMKIIMFSLMLAVLYGQLQYLSSYECNIESAMNKDLMGDEHLLRKILRLRRNRHYYPLKYADTAAIRQEERNWRQWRILINFFVVIILYLVLTMEVLFTWDGLYIQTQEHIENMFDPSLSPHKITNFAYYAEYLQKVVLPALDTRTWYNGSKIMSQLIWKQEMGYLKDYCTRIMGYPRIRQQRVREDSCKVPIAMQFIFTQCNAPMTWSNMDKTEYWLRWTQPEKQVLPIDINTPWVFSQSKNPLLMCGPYTEKCYLPGGYTAKMDYDPFVSNNTLQNLLSSEWFDGLTRVVFFDMVIYNVNTDLIAYVSPMLEKLADGSFHLFVKSAILHPRSSSFMATLIILLTFTFYYFLRIVLLFNRKGLTYLFSWTGQLDVFLNFLLYITMISLCFYRNARKSYLYEWQLREEDDLQMPADIFLHRDLLRYETAILVIIIPAQVLHNARFGKKTFIIFKTLKYGFGLAFSLALLEFIFYVAFILIDVINNNRSVFCPINRQYSPTTYNICSDNIIYLNFVGSRPFNISMCVVVSIASYLACVSVVYGYKASKLHYRYCEDFNLLTFIWEKLTIVGRCMSRLKSKITNITKNKRLRAGGGDSSIGESKYETNKTYGHTKQICNDLNYKFDVIIQKLRELENN